MTYEKRYLGDGAYVTYNGQQLVLTTENGVDVTNTIFLEPEVFESLMRYARELNFPVGTS